MSYLLQYDGGGDTVPYYAPSTAVLVEYETAGSFFDPNRAQTSVISKSIEVQYIPPSSMGLVFNPSPATSATPGVYSPPSSSQVASPVASSSPSSSQVASPVASSSPSSSQVASPVSVPTVVQPQITRSTDSARQTRRLQMAGSQVAGTVTQVSPLRVVVDGATTDSPANVLDAATYVLGARIAILIRNPQMPLVQGVLS